MKEKNEFQINQKKERNANKSGKMMNINIASWRSAEQRRASHDIDGVAKVKGHGRYRRSSVKFTSTLKIIKMKMNMICAELVCFVLRITGLGNTINAINLVI